MSRTKYFGLSDRQLRLITLAAVIGLAILSTTQQALAHHPLGGRVPANLWEGLLSGLAHPVIGLDHLAFVIAVGLVAAGRGGAIIPGGFVFAALVGTGIHLLRLDLPLTEVAVAISVIACGTMLVLPNRPQTSVLIGLAAIAGLFHGYAYGEAIIGAQTTTVVAYLMGFSCIQLAIAMSAQVTASIISQHTAKPLPWMRFIGLLICGIGAVFLTNSLVG